MINCQVPKSQGPEAGIKRQEKRAKGYFLAPPGRGSKVRGKEEKDKFKLKIVNYRIETSSP